MSVRHCNGSLKVNFPSELCCLRKSNNPTGLSDVERAFVHVDYEGSHDVATEHKALYKKKEPKEPFAQRIQQKFKSKPVDENAPKRSLKERISGKKQ